MSKFDQIFERLIKILALLYLVFAIVLMSTLLIGLGLAAIGRIMK